VANHRAVGRAEVRKHRLAGGTHRDSAISAGAVKVGVLGVLATATIAAPLAAAAAGVEESAPQGETIAQAQPVAAPQAPAPVALPAADAAQVASAVRADGDAANRSEERTSPASSEKTEKAQPAVTAEPEASGIEVSVPAPVEEAAAAQPVGHEGYLRPVDGPITSGYGGRVHPVLGYFKGHDGVDFGAACGTPVHAAQAGTVVAVEHNSASGNRVKVDHGNGVITGYYHLQGFNTSVGATVAAGDTIGYVGSTGRSTGCHLHFAKMDESGAYSDPMSLLK